MSRISIDDVAEKLGKDKTEVMRLLCYEIAVAIKTRTFLYKSKKALRACINNTKSKFLPSEQKFIERFNVSRTTIRAALKEAGGKTCKRDDLSSSLMTMASKFSDRSEVVVRNKDRELTIMSNFIGSKKPRNKSGIHGVGLRSSTGITPDFNSIQEIHIRDPDTDQIPELVVETYRFNTNYIRNRRDEGKCQRLCTKNVWFYIDRAFGCNSNHRLACINALAGT